MGPNDLSKIKKVITGSKSISNLLIEEKLNKLMYSDDENREERIGMHGSGVVASDEDFCYRQQVLSFFYKGVESPIPLWLKRIFLNGWYVHEKWQKLFIQTGIAIAVEQRGESKEWNLLFTPDATIKLGNKLYVVEIKSVNTYQFQKMKSHPSGEKQLQLYMHMTGIPNGFVLCEDKNTQDIKVFLYTYDAIKAKEFVKRMYKVKRYKKRFMTKGVLPIQMCESANCKKALGCAYRDCCFDINCVLLEKGAKTGKGASDAGVNL